MVFSRFEVGSILLAGVFALSGWSSTARANTPPVSVAGGPYEVPVGGWLVLDGTRSHEPDAGDSIVSYAWDLNSDGVYDNSAFAGAVIPWKNVATLFASPPAIGASFPISLKVTDGAGATNVSTATVKIVAPLGPVKPIGVTASPGVVAGNSISQGSSRSVSDDGRFVVFTSAASDMVPGQIEAGGVYNISVFLYDRTTGLTSLISHAFGSAVTEANNTSISPMISGNGRYIVFTSDATNLTNPPSAAGASLQTLFVHDRVAGSTVRIGAGINVSISRDGRFVVFVSSSTTLVSGQIDTNNATDVFLYDLQAASFHLVSRTAASSTATGNALSDYPHISADGNYVVYLSLASNLVAGQVDTSGSYDVFLFDRQAGTAKLVSRSLSSALASAGGSSGPQGISDDGHYVVFSSLSGALVAGQVSNNNHDIFVYDRETEAVSLVSRAASFAATDANNSSHSASISGDGRFVAFESYATDLVAGQIARTPSYSQVFVHDRQTGLTALVSHTADSNITPIEGVATSSKITPDGRRVVFYSDPHVYIYECDTASLNRITRSPARNVWITNELYNVSVNYDGAYVSFDSNSMIMVSGQQDENYRSDVFLWSGGSGKVELVSRSAAKPTPLSAPISGYVMSADGRYIAFESVGDNLVPGVVDDNGAQDVYLYDRTLGTTQLVSRSFGSSLVSANGISGSPSISADGRYVAFISDGQNLVSGQVSGYRTVVFVFDRVSGTNVMISKAAGSSATPSSGTALYPVISKDGAYVAFLCNGDNLISGQVNDTELGGLQVFLCARSTGAINLVSNVVGLPKNGSRGDCGEFVLSSDGRYVAFPSSANNVIATPAGYTWSNTTQIYRYDRNTGLNSLVSHRTGALTTPANGDSTVPLMSDDGSSLVFLSMATDLIANFTDQNAAYNRDLFGYTASNGLVKLISGTSPGSTYSSSGDNYAPALSSDGRFVTFTNEGLHAPRAHVFIHDRTNTTTTLITRADGSGIVAANEGGQSGGISADGRFVTFFSSASNIRSIQTTPGRANVFVYDRTDDSVRLASRSFINQNAEANGFSTVSRISSDGRYVLFDSTATDLAPNAVGGSYLFANFVAPTITNNPLTKTGTFGTAFSGFTITASQTPTSFYASGLPAGLVFDSTSGTITGTPTQGGTFPVKLYALNDAGASEATLSLSITLPSLTFAQWRTGVFNTTEQANAAISGATADPDNDGVSNLLEYAFGLHPKQTNFDGAPFVMTENGYLTLTYIRFKNATGTTFLPQVSGDLTTWSSGATFIDSVSVTAIAGTQLERVIVRDKTPATGFGPRFIRLRVTSQ